MSAFQRDDQGKIGAVFTSQESHVLQNLTEQLLELLGEGTSSISPEADPFLHLVGFGANEAPPEDPVLRRLLPSAYDDPAAASEFRRYTEHGVRMKKRAHAMMIYEALLPQDDDWNAEKPLDRGSLEISIHEGDVMDWLAALNDLRLALAVRLGIESDDGPRGVKNEVQSKKFELMKEDDPMKAVYAVYNWLGSIQHSLIEAITPEHPQ
jgi:hypothetical protein